MEKEIESTDFSCCLFRQQMKIEVPLTALFDHPSIEQLSHAIDPFFGKRDEVVPIDDFKVPSAAVVDLEVCPRQMGVNKTLQREQRQAQTLLYLYNNNNN